MLRILVGAMFLAVLAAGRTTLAHTQEELETQASAAYSRDDFARAGALYSELVENGWGDARTAFNAACCFARASERDAAFDALDVAIDLGYFSTKDLASDTDLEALWGDVRWQPVLDASKANAERQQLLWQSPVWQTDYRENISTAEKIAGLSRLWAGAKYNFVSFDLVPDLNWDASYFEFLERVMATRSTLEYYRELELFTAQLHDGHTYVTPPVELRKQLWSQPSLRTRLVEGHVVVVAVYDDVKEHFGVRTGDELIEIDGTPAREYSRENVRPYQFASTKQDLDTKAYETRLLAGAEGSIVSLRLGRPDGSQYACRLRRLWGEERKSVVPPVAPMTHARVGKAGEIVCVMLNTFNTPETADQFETAFGELSQARAMILDVRENGGGNSSVGWRILKLLTSEAFESSTWYTRQYLPSYRAWDQPEGRFGRSASMIPPDGKRLYEGPVVVLTSPRTYSAAEDFCVSFRSMKRGLILGEPTGGSTGQPLRLQLPGGVSASVCTKRDRFPDGTEFVGVGIQPDVAVVPTLSDLRAGRDSALEAAIAELERQLSRR